MVALHLLKLHLPSQMWELGSMGRQLDLAVAFLWGWIHGHEVNFQREHIQVVTQPIVENPRIKAKVLKCNTEFSKYLQHHRRKDHRDAATSVVVDNAAKKEPRDDESIKLEASGPPMRHGRPIGSF